MPDHATVLYTLALLVVIAPTVLVVILGVTSLAERTVSEETTGRLIRWSVTVALICAGGVFVGMLASGARHVVLDLGHWVSIHSPGTDADQDYHFKVKLVYDRLSVPFLTLSLVLCGIIGAFAVKYMHRERGYNRFFVLYSFFVLGMVVTSLAG